MFEPKYGLFLAIASKILALYTRKSTAVFHPRTATCYKVDIIFENRIN
jgi:hypothetical protein